MGSSLAGRGRPVRQPRPRRKPAFDLEGRKRAHWAWHPVGVQPAPGCRTAPGLPATSIASSWPGSKRPASGPRLAADRRTLLRRLHFDLTGLPPTPAEVVEFLADDSPDAYERVVDRLLAAPQFGEHWARHWLDLVRYAESRGHEFDYTIPNAWQYRDYVIRAFNADVPYDQFVREHVAGDLLARPRLHPTTDSTSRFWARASGFSANGCIRRSTFARTRPTGFDNAVDTFSKTFLGLTVACARCHDHKFDAISTKDYYALFGFLRSSRFRLAAFDVEGPNRHVADQSGPSWPIDSKCRRCARRWSRRLEPQVERTADYLLAAREALRAARAGRSRLDERIRPDQRSAADRGLPPASGNDRQRPRRRRRAAGRLGRIPAGGTGQRGRSACTFGPCWPAIARPTTRDVGPKALERCWPMARAEPGGCRGDEDRARDRSTTPTARRPIGSRTVSRSARGRVHPGDMIVSGNRRPAGRSKSPRCSAAENDPIWDGLKLAPGVENEPSRTGGWVRAGRTLHTKTFRLTSGSVYYLLKGSCHVYAEVDSHRMNNGPLHGKMIAKFDAGESFRWVRQDLTGLWRP